MRINDGTNWLYIPGIARQDRMNLEDAKKGKEKKKEGGTCAAAAAAAVDTDAKVGATSCGL